MAVFDQLLRRWGFVKLERYGLVRTPDDRIVTTRPKILDDGSGGRIVGWQDEDRAALALPAWEPRRRRRSALVAEKQVIPTISLPRQASPAAVMTDPVAAEPVVDEDDWEWTIALARARADAEAMAAPAPQSQPPVAAKLEAQPTAPAAGVIADPVSPVTNQPVSPTPASQLVMTSPWIETPPPAAPTHPAPSRPARAATVRSAPARAATVRAAAPARPAATLPSPAPAEAARASAAAAPPGASRPVPATVIPVPTLPALDLERHTGRLAPVVRPSQVHTAPRQPNRFPKGTGELTPPLSEARTSSASPEPAPARELPAAARVVALPSSRATGRGNRSGRR